MTPCNVLEIHRRFKGVFAAVLISKKGPAAGPPWHVRTRDLVHPRLLPLCRAKQRHTDAHMHSVLPMNRTAIKSRQFAFLFAVRIKDNARPAVCDVIKAPKQFVRFSWKSAGLYDSLQTAVHKADTGKATHSLFKSANENWPYFAQFSSYFK
jgi:hypothetical protein